MTQFNLLDAVVLLILFGSVVYSALKGFVRELLGMLSLVAAFFISVSFYRVASEPFKEVVKTENIALFLGFASIFLGTLIVGALVIWAVQKLVKFAKVQWFDRLLGAAFGFIRGWILGSVVFLVLTSFDLQSERVRDSQLAPYYLPGARIIALATPHDLKTRFMDGYRVVEKWWREHS
ncbi:MAG TPA: CvpA family protein [Terriglobia bacterium]|nr:CvpA family protein [Terriglobia bacterium]